MALTTTGQCNGKTYPENICTLLAPVKTIILICQTDIKCKEKSRQGHSQFRISKLHSHAGVPSSLKWL